MDTKLTREFIGSPVRPLIAFAFWSAIAGSLVYVVVGTDRVSTSTDLLLFGSVAAFVGALLLAFLVKAIRSSRATVVVSPDGIRDRRVSTKIIPWKAIDGIASVKEHRRRSRIMLLMLDPAFENDPAYVRSLRLGARLDRGGGRQGVQVKSTELRASLDELMSVAVAYKKVALDETPVAERRMVATVLPEATLRMKTMTERRPYAAFALLAVLILVFLVEGALAPHGEAVGSLSAQTIANYGGMSRNLVDAGEWWRFFTGPLLHSGPLHILMNGVALVFGGYLLERLLGWRWFLTAFAVGALSGGAGSYLLNGHNVVTVGASGGILGLFATTMIVAFRHPVALVRANLMRGAAQVLIPTLIPFASTKGMHVDVAAHCGGALGGVLAGFMIVNMWDVRAIAPRGAAMATLASTAYVATSVFAVAMAARAYDYRKALDPYLPSLFATLLQQAPDLIKEHPRDPRIRYALAIRLIGAGRIDEGEAALKAIEDDPQANRLWPSIGASASKALAKAKADVAAGRRPFTGSFARKR